MKIRAIGTGSKFCRHPLTPASWVVSSGKDLTLIGAPWPILPSLERYGYGLDQVSVITLMSPNIDQIAGLLEIASKTRARRKKPTLAAPGGLLGVVRERLEPELGYFLDEAFDVKTIARLHIKEEYHSETLTFVKNFLDPRIPSYAVRFESAKVFISGDTQLNEDWLFREMACDVILHACSTNPDAGLRTAALSELQALPGYLQSKMWLYGYEVEQREAEQPFPMLYLPPGAWVFDSDRRDKTINKERFIRENSKKMI